VNLNLPALHSMTARRPAPTDKVPIRQRPSAVPRRRILRNLSSQLGADVRIVLPPGVAPSDFWFKSTLLQLPHAVLFRRFAPGHRMVRGPERSRSAPRISCWSRRSGRRRVHLRRRHVRLRPGDLGLYDYSQGYDSVTTDFEMIGLMVGRDRCRLWFLAPSVHGTY